MKKWTDEAIGDALLKLSSDGRLPSNDELKAAGLSGLGFAVSNTGGFYAWAKKLGLETKGGGAPWTEERITSELQPFCEEFGRMPSVGELRNAGRNDLACVISKRGGFRCWAKRLSLGQKGSETHRGQKWERSESVFFRALGMNVEEQSTKAPFDLLVNGKRVDVKSSILNKTGWYQFGSIKYGKDCDFYDLLCVEDDKIKGRFIVPVAHANVGTISLMPKSLIGRGKYGPFLGATDLLWGSE